MPIKYTTLSDQDSIFLKKEGQIWKIVGKPGLQSKGPHRNGTFKDGFNKNMLYVYEPAVAKRKSNGASIKHASMQKVGITVATVPLTLSVIKNIPNQSIRKKRYIDWKLIN